MMYTTLKADLVVPFVAPFRCHSHINAKCDNLKAVGFKGVKAVQVGLSIQGWYWAIFYINRKPSKKAIKKLLQEAKFESGT